MDPVVKELAAQGLLGLLLLAVTYAYWRKDEALQSEKLARINDAKDFNKIAMDLQSKVIDAVNKLADILDELKKMQGPPRGGLR